MLEYLQLIGGLVLLLVAGDALVSGSASLAVKFKISPLLIGLTIVAFGTSAPELLVSISAAFNGAPGIAIGNVVGSNIANILIVLGLPAVFFAMNADNAEVRKNAIIVLVASVVFMLFTLTGMLVWWHGAILFSGIILFLFLEFKNAKKGSENNEGNISDIESELPEPSKNAIKITLLIVFGIIGLPIGAHYLVAGASSIASDFGISDAAIGLSIVALGTSLPELAAVFSSVRKNHSDLAIGNILGSNLFNLLTVMGLTAMIHPIAIAPRITQIGLTQPLGDIWIMLAVTILLLLVIFFIKKINRVVGLLFTALYLLYIFIVLA